MRIPGIGWLVLKGFVAFFLPVLAYVWISQSILHSHLSASVTNDPEAGLSRSLTTLRLSLDRQWENLSSTAFRIAQDELLAENLRSPVRPARLRKLLQNLAPSEPSSLFILANARGKVLYDTIGLASPLPQKTPDLGTKLPDPILPQPTPFSILDWPGINQALIDSASN